MDTLSAVVKKYNDTSLILRIFIGLIIGAVVGMVAPTWTAFGLFGDVFVGCLKAIAPILVFVLIASALCKGSSKLDKRFGLVLWLYARIGVRLPRVAVEQGTVGIAVPDRLRFGDVLLFKRRGPGWHIGLYLARGRFVHAEGRESGVTVSLLNASGYARRLCRARRYLR